MMAGNKKDKKKKKDRSQSSSSSNSKTGKKDGKLKEDERNEAFAAYDNDDDDIDAKRGGRFDTSLKPQFKKPVQHSSKVVLDERFSSVLTDPRFQVDVKRDKYGRKTTSKSKSSQERVKKELSAFYTAEDDGDDEEERPKADPKQRPENDDDESTSSSSDDDDSKNDEKGEPKQGDDADPISRIAYLTALSRGEIDVSSSSSSSSSEDESDDEEQSDDDSDDDYKNDIQGKNEVAEKAAGVLDPASRQLEEEVELTTVPSPYLAVMDMDWSHVRAVDVFAIISSFTAPGSVKRVRVFPSDFGMAKMKKEEEIGPTGLWKEKADDDDVDVDEQQVEEADSDDDDSADADSADGSENGHDYDSQDEEANVDEMYAEAMASQNEKFKSDFDPEQLRAYEASRLKYYFAIVELASAAHADIAYKEVDGMEFEHSSAALDCRSIPSDQIDNVVKDRPLRDEAASLPSNYIPPEFVVSALQQTNVQCTWESGDRERERTLTRYASSGQDWKAAAENDDLKAYLASDASSDEEEDNEDGDGGHGSKKAKAARIRQMLGLDSDDDESGSEDGNKNTLNELDNESGSSSDSGDDEVGDEDGGKQVKFIPGEKKLQDKIRSKLEPQDDDTSKELTPWEKYQEKRKEKRRVKRQEAKAKRKEVNRTRKGGSAKQQDDDFFVDSENEEEDKAKGPKDASRAKQELELLVAGDDNEEEARDYDMRGLQRIEKNKDKKLRGSRKRKEAALAASVGGTDFEVNVKDDRFRAVLDGQDDRFGIDRTDPSYKDTSAMRNILAEQSKRRKEKRRKKAKTASVEKVAPPDANTEDKKTSSGASDLSLLVNRLKSKVK